MGKNLKGRECGKGIYQRKDGFYSARFVDRAGKRHEKYFQTVPEARNWIADAKYADAHAEVLSAPILRWMSGLISGSRILSEIWLPISSATIVTDTSTTFSR